METLAHCWQSKHLYNHHKTQGRDSSTCESVSFLWSRHPNIGYITKEKCQNVKETSILSLESDNCSHQPSYGVNQGAENGYNIVQDHSEHQEGPARWSMLSGHPLEETRTCLEFLSIVIWLQGARAHVIKEASPSLFHMKTQSIPYALKKVLPPQQYMNGRAEIRVVGEPHFRLCHHRALWIDVRDLVNISTPS